MDSIVSRSSLTQAAGPLEVSVRGLPGLSPEPALILSLCQPPRHCRGPGQLSETVFKWPSVTSAGARILLSESSISLTIPEGGARPGSDPGHVHHMVWS